MFGRLLTTTIAALALGVASVTSAAAAQSNEPMPDSPRADEQVPRGSFVDVQTHEGIERLRVASDDTVQHMGPERKVVYFRFDSARLTGEAQGKLNSFVNNLDLGGQEQVIVAGHTDRAGPVGYNQALSKDRAMAVISFLRAVPIEDGGILPNDLRITWFGETNPAVETVDGVRELKNRRVTLHVVQQSVDQ